MSHLHNLVDVVAECGKWIRTIFWGLYDFDCIVFVLLLIIQKCNISTISGVVIVLSWYCKISLNLLFSSLVFISVFFFSFLVISCGMYQYAFLPFKFCMFTINILIFLFINAIKRVNSYYVHQQNMEKQGIWSRISYYFILWIKYYSSSSYWYSELCGVKCCKLLISSRWVELFIF